MIHLTPEILEGAYEFLKTMRPFARWNLPPADEVEFRVVGTQKRFGWHQYEKGKGHILAVSANAIGSTHTLLTTVAHEMGHMHADRQGERAAHGRKWQAAAKLICKHHGFNLVEF